MAEKVASVREIVEIAPSVLQVAADCVDPPSWPYRPGQFLSLRCGGDGSVRRSYSISSHPSTAGSFELLVKLIPGGVGSEFFSRLRPGAELHFTGPMGFFVPDLSHAGDVLFAATGAGIAAAHPMIHDLLARPEERGRVLLYWGMRGQDDLYWLDRIESHRRSPRFEGHIALSRPPSDWTDLTGRIQSHVLMRAPTLDRPVFYLVGHGDMIRDIKGALEASGVDRKKQIRNEIFYPATKK